MKLLIGAAGMLAANLGFANVFHFSIHKTMDEAHGIVAYTCLIPSGWKAQEKCFWAGQYGFFREVDSPDKSCALTELYNVSNQFQLIGGRLKQGMAPPRSVSDFLVQTFRQSHPGVRYDVIKATNKSLPPEVAQARHASFGGQSEVVLHFQRNGEPYEINFTAEISGKTFGQGGGGAFSVQTGSWNIDLVLGIEGPVSKDGILTKDLLVLLGSNRDTPDFDRVDAQFSGQTLKNANEQIKLDGEISKAIAKSADDRRNAIMGRARKGASSDYLDFLGNAETYKSPFTNEDVQLSNGYKEAWTDGQGNYIMSDQADYDPNKDSDTTWTRMKKKG
jgi:hypothetical protein